LKASGRIAKASKLMKPRIRLVGILSLAVAPAATAGAQPMPWLMPGIRADRQVRTTPPESIMRLGIEVIREIRGMGFGFLNLLINPEVVQKGRSVGEQAMALP
jgi:hypothetical protein